MSPTELEELGSQITCAQAIDFMRAYLDGELPRGQQEIFAAHLAICEDCRNYLASYESTIRLMQQSNDTELTNETYPPIPDELLNAILKALPAENED
jgi:anti-sigma factor RsiW